MFAPFLHGMPGPIVRPPNVGAPRMLPSGPQPIGTRPVGVAPAGGINPQQSMFHPMPAQPIASFDHLKQVHTIKKSGLYRLKKGEKVVPLSSLG